MKKSLALLLVGSLCLSILALTPTAAAHECAAYTGCDAKACTEGEDHKHTNYNLFVRDEYCESKKPAPPPPPRNPESCDYFGQNFPPAVCRLVEFDPNTAITTVEGGAGMAVALAGGAAGSVNPSTVCPAMKTPTMDFKPGDAPQVEC